MVKTGTAAGGKGGLKELGGVKGAVRRGAAWCLEAAAAVRDRGRGVLKWGVKVGGTVSFALATTSMIVLMPLLFEIAREGQMLETERAQIKDLKGKGYSDRQLQEMGFSENALHSPSVASLKA